MITIDKTYHMHYWVKIMMVTLAVTFTQHAKAQTCMAPGAVNATNSSPGEYTLTATSLHEGVTAHRWYNSSGQEIVPTTSTPPGDIFFSSSLTKTFTQSEYYEVSAVCNGVESERTIVSFTMDNNTQIKILPSTFPEPDGVCANGFTLTASGGSNYSWRKDDPSSTVISTQTVLSPTLSGTYYLTGKDSYGNWKTVSINIILIPDVGTPLAPFGTTNRCQGGGTSQYTSSADDADYYEWSLSNGAAGSISSSGLVSWSPGFSGQVVVNVTAFGCGSPRSKSTTVNIMPTNPEMVVTIGGPDGVCGSHTLALMAVVENAAGNLTYEWKKNETVVTSVSPLTEASVLVLEEFEEGDRITCGVTTDACVVSPQVFSNEYLVHITSGGDITLSPSVFPEPDGVCADGFYLSAGGGKMYQWHEGSASSEVLSVEETFYPIASGHYFLTGINECGIYQEVSLPIVLITDPGAPDLALKGPTMICEGDDAYVKADYNLSQEDHYFNWKKNDVAITTTHPEDPTILLLENVVPGDRITCTAYSQNACHPTQVTAEFVFRVDDECGFSYLEQRQAKKEGKADLFENNEKLEVNAGKQYIDGLGRTKLTIQRWGTHTGQDIITPVAYDEYGREEKKYLGYTTATGEGKYRSDAIAEQAVFYQTASNIAHDDEPYAVTVFENSPLSRVLRQGAPGEDWQPLKSDFTIGKTIDFEYKLNGTQDGAILWQIQNESLIHMGLVADGHWQKNITVDEEGHQVMEFSNQKGQTVLKRVQSHENGSAERWADTYYVYDDLGNLRYVLPPMANEELKQGAVLNDELLSKWCFSYRYDIRQRMSAKRVPGSDWVYMVYDNRDRLVLTQDGNQQIHNQWIFTQYDQLNRPVATGIYTHGSTVDQSAMQAYVNGEIGVTTSWYESYTGTGTLGYDQSSFPKNVAASDYLSITYYDNYEYLSLAGFGSTFEYDAAQLGSATTPQGTYSFPATSFTTVKGQVTGSMVKTLDGQNTWLRSVVHYDDRYRVIQAVSEDYKGGLNRSSTLYNFPGWVLSTYTARTEGADTYGTRRRFEYDHTGRLLRGYHELITPAGGQGEVLLAENKYNELGELIEKNLHVENNVPHQSIDYRYNIRGWLESINNSTLIPGTANNPDDASPDLFGMELIYNNPLNGVTPAGN